MNKPLKFIEGRVDGMVRLTEALQFLLNLIEGHLVQRVEISERVEVLVEDRPDISLALAGEMPAYRFLKMALVKAV